MPSIIQLSPHIANLIAAGEVVERPASVVKELLENSVDAGATKVTIEIRDGGMTFLRVTDNGCGMEPKDARTAFLRHATSKLRTAEDLASIGTMGFRGEALAAIASVSRIDLMTKPTGAIAGTSIHLEAGNILSESEAGCPDGTTIIIRDLFFNTPARMKFMKSDSVEGSRVAAAVQLQALAHPEVSITFIRDGKQTLSTPGGGSLQAAVYCIYGRDFANMIPVDSKWDGYYLTGFVSKPTDARPSRTFQTFFVNDRPVKSRLLVSALEEAYRNQLMVGKFPTCVLHLRIPNSAVDVNVHPAKTEVKFLNEKAVFDCMHYGVLAALNKTPDRPQVQFRQQKQEPIPASVPQKAPSVSPSTTAVGALGKPKQDFFRAMTTEEFKSFSGALKDAPMPRKEAAEATTAKLPKVLPVTADEHSGNTLRETVVLPVYRAVMPEKKALETTSPAPVPKLRTPLMEQTAPEKSPEVPAAEIQESIPMPELPDWRMIGELYHTYIIVEQCDNAFLIDKHAAHERILFDKLKANQEAISSQALLSPVPVRLNPNAAAELLSNKDMLEALGFEIDEFGDSTVLLRQIPMDLAPAQAAETIESLASDLLSGRHESKDTVRDELLHTVACKAAIKAGWINDEKELLTIARQVMEREDLKYCPHGRPICVTLSKKQVEKQFKRI